MSKMLTANGKEITPIEFGKCIERWSNENRVFPADMAAQLRLTLGRYRKLVRGTLKITDDVINNVDSYIGLANLFPPGDTGKKRRALFAIARLKIALDDLQKLIAEL